MSGISDMLSIIGMGFQFAGGVAEWAQSQIGMAGQIEQLSFQQDLLDIQMGTDEALFENQLAQFDRMSDFIRENAELQEGIYESQQRQVDSQITQVELQQAQLENQGKQIDSKITQTKLAQENIRAQQSINQVGQNRAEMKDALQRGDLTLARNAATREARIKNAVRQFTAGAAGGRSAFSRAYEAMSVNKLASIDQAGRALEKEGLFRKSEFDLANKVLENEIKVKGEDIKQLGLDKQNLSIQDKILDESIAQLGEQNIQLGLTIDQLDLATTNALNDIGLQRQGAEIQQQGDRAGYETQSAANTAAQETLQDQIDAGNDPGQFMDWNDTVVGTFGSDVTGSAGQFANDMGITF